MQADLIWTYIDPLRAMPVSHVWNGYGSALFIEFGALSPSHRRRRDGSPGNGDGEYGLGIEWGWRIEERSSILTGSDSEKSEWPAVFAKLMGQRVTEVRFLGHLPEISVALSSGLRVASFMTTAGGPDWALFDRRAKPNRWLHVRDGVICEDRDTRLVR